ncbi:hypothetical protein DPMN_112099 [Dreissena polymorpha]|uniref:Uncharacterized protein n=1 Tax=Dreissena polymorpha TaxID=45954 RepID=A0A9D4KF33_DREPO|nr:hypothetical protein DPMN_112099 [Dreissena polymorpha]
MGNLTVLNKLEDTENNLIPPPPPPTRYTTTTTTTTKKNADKQDSESTCFLGAEHTGQESEPPGYHRGEHVTVVHYNIVHHHHHYNSDKPSTEDQMDD